MHKSRYSEILYWIAFIALILNLLFNLIPTLSQFISVILPIFLFSILIMPLMDNSKNSIKIISLVGIMLYFTNHFLFQISLLEASMIFLGVGIFIIKTGFSDIYSAKKRSDQNVIFSKPSRERSSFKLLLDYLSSLILPILNPFQLTQQIFHVFGQMISLGRNIRDIPHPDDYDQKTEFELPFKGTWTVANGGIRKEDSHSWNIINQRYAYDLVKSDPKGKTHDQEGDKPEDYLCYRKDVLAPADGKIIKVRDGIRDFPMPGTMRTDHMCKDFRGNFLMIKHNENEFSFIAHLIPGSIQVAEGEKVEQGEKLAECGNSGHSTEPHIHFHVQNHPNFYLGMGLPIKFKKVKIDGVEEKNAYIRKGERVQNL